MSDSIDSEAAASMRAVCYPVSGDNEGETIQRDAGAGQGNIGQRNIGQANICQAGGWNLDPVPFDGTCGARTVLVAAAPKDGSDNVCEPDYCPLPPVCLADDDAAARDAAKARGE